MKPVTLKTLPPMLGSLLGDADALLKLHDSDVNPLVSPSTHCSHHYQAS